MSFQEQLCLSLNKVFKKTKKRGRSSPAEYSIAEYENAGGRFKLFEGKVELRGKTFLDAGCGLGGKTVYYAEQGTSKICGLDLDPKHIRHARHYAESKGRTDIDFINGSLFTLPFTDNSFDIISLNDVVEHVERKELENMFKELKRVIKPGGRIFLEFPPWTSPDASHLYDYIYTPWCQVFFSDETLINVVKKIGDRGRHGIMSEIDHYYALNRIEINDFKELITRLDYKPILLKFRYLKNKKVFGYVPFINKYLVTRVIAVLSK